MRFATIDFLQNLLFFQIIVSFVSLQYVSIRCIKMFKVIDRSVANTPEDENSDYISYSMAQNINQITDHNKRIMLQNNMDYHQLESSLPRMKIIIQYGKRLRCVMIYV